MADSLFEGNRLEDGYASTRKLRVSNPGIHRGGAENAETAQRTKSTNAVRGDAPKPESRFLDAPFRKIQVQRMIKAITSGIALFISVILSSSGGSIAQEKPDLDMGKMQMVFLKRAREWKPANKAEPAKTEKDHRDYIVNLIESRKCALEGTVPGNEDLYEILVFKTESIEEIQTAVKSFPGVKAGMLQAEVLSWYASRAAITAAKSPIVQSHYVFGLLVRGPKWTSAQTEDSKKIQSGHMANINRLAELGKLVLAGPYFSGGDRAGVFIFKVDSIEEAESLTNTDPAVIAGRLKIELHHWLVPKGMLK